MEKAYAQSRPREKSHTGELTARVAARVMAGWVICVWLLSSLSLNGQTLSGLHGTVTDATGAAIQEARVTITSADTCVRRITATGSTGSYHLTDLNPGVYTVTVEKPGFKTSVQNSVFVQAAGMHIARWAGEAGVL